MAGTSKKWGAAPIALVGSAVGAASRRKPVPVHKVARAARSMPAQVQRAAGHISVPLGRRRRRKGLIGKISGRSDLERLMKIAGTVGAVIGAVSTGAEVLSEFRKASQSAAGGRQQPEERNGYGGSSASANGRPRGGSEAPDESSQGRTRGSSPRSSQSSNRGDVSRRATKRASASRPTRAKTTRAARSSTRSAAKRAPGSGIGRRATGAKTSTTRHTSSSNGARRTAAAKRATGSSSNGARRTAAAKRQAGSTPRATTRSR